MKKWFIITIFVTILLFFASGHLTTGWAEAEDHSVPASQQTPKGKDARQIVGKTRIDTDFGNIPLYFIPNKGQMNQEALFCAKTSRYTLWLTKQGLVFDSVKKTHPTPPGHPFQKSRNRIKPARDVSRLIFLNANQQPEVVPQEPTTHKVNYFKGKDNSQWHTQIPTSKAVYYKNLYKNTDLKIYGLEKQIEYDWVVKPGGNPGDIRFQYREVKEVSIDEQGNLVVRTAFGKWIHKKPSAYQEIGKAQAAGCTNRRIEVDVKFKKAGENTYSFVLGEYDKDCELIIDPMVVAFSTYLGGSLNEELFDIAVDGTGALIAVGYTYSTNFPASGAYQGTLAGPSDSFISKFSADGTSLVFSTYLGGSDHDAIKSIRLGSDGVIYVGGVTLSTDYPTVSPYQGSNAGGPQDGLISKLSADGATLLYSTFLGGSGRDYVEGIAVNSSGEICVAGITHSSDFPLQNAYISTYDGGSIEDYGDAFASKLSASGGSLVYSTYLGKSGLDNAYDIAVDSSGAAYVVGTTTCTNFPTISAFQSTLGGSTDGFITKFPASGTPPVFSTYLGGYQGDIIYDIHIDGSGGVYVSGRTSSSDFPTSSGAFQYSKPGGSGTYDYDGFIGKFTSTGTRVYTTYLGASGGITEINGITVDSSGAAYVTGFTESPNFPLQDAFCTLLNSTRDAVTVKLSANGSGIDFSSYLGSGDFAQGQGIGVDSSGAIYLGGNTGTALPTYRAYQDTYAGGTSDIFVTKIASCTYADITVTVPNGGDEWQVGSSQDIFWTAPEVIQHVKIEYSTDSGGTWNTITDSTPNQGGYTWSSVPDTTSANCLVRVSDVDAGGVPPDESNGVFTIYSQPIEVVFPNGGDVLMQEDMVSIQWTSISEVTQVELYYSTDSGMTWNLIDGPISNTGMYDWIIPTTPSTECLVKVKDADSSDEDISDAVFTIRAPSITIVHPNGNDTYMQEDIMFIDWNYEGHVNDVNIYYSTDSGTNWELITGPIPNTGNYEWLIPTTPSTECLVKVEDAAGHAQDISDALFTIRAPSITIVHPNGNTTYMQEDIMFIDWSYEGHVNNVNIYYTTDSGANWQLITGPISNTGNYEWLIPPTPSTQCLVKVEDAAGHAQDISDALFTIRAPSITIVHPNGNASYMQEDIMFIDWNYEGHVNNVNIYYTTDSGANWQLITGPIPNTGNYEWLIPPTPSTQCLVKVEDAAGHAQDISDALFTILPPTITVIYPNGSEFLQADTLCSISWDYAGNIVDVLLQYSTDSGSTWNDIAGPIPNTGTYDWTVPNDPSSECLVKVLDAAMYAQDTSDALFTISPPSIPALQRDALIALYNSTDGDNWTDNTNWRLPGDPTQFNDPGTEHTWFGVTCTADHTNVIEINLPGNFLNGTLPDLSALTELTKLDLGNNQLTGTLPATLNNLANLQVLDLGANFITGTLPDLSGLTNLTQLNLSTNIFDGNIPTWISLLTALNTLNLSENQFTGTIPDLSTLTQLTEFNVYANQLSGTIPTWINSLTALNTLHLGLNQFSGEIPDLGSLTQLTQLNLYGNQLTGGIPTWINLLTALTKLDLSANQLTGTIPDISSLIALTDLYLQNNDLNGSIPDLSSLTSLEYLFLNNNQLSGSIPNISGLAALYRLDLSGNQLSGAIPSEIGTLTGLRYLLLHGNKLSGPLPSSITNLTNLLDNDSSIRWNALYTDDSGIRDFMNAKQSGGDWESTQTIAPTAVSAGEATHNSIKVSWTAIQYQSGAGGYMVYYTTTPGSGYTLSGTTPDKYTDNYTVTGLDPNTTYYFVVEAFTDSHANNQNTVISEYSTEASAATLETPTLTVTAPDGGQSWEGGTTQNITWNSTGSITDVKIEYSIDNGASWNTITASTANSGSYSWTVPNTPSSNCLVKISDTTGPASDTSNGVFTIAEQRTLTVTTPNGTETWEGGFNQAVTWNSTGTIANVMIEYSTDNGSTWNTVTASTANTGTYDWTVPNTPSSTCLVKVSDTAGPASDVSNAVFTILEQRTVTVIAPNDSENWMATSIHDITWLTTGAIGTVSIDYSTDSGGSWNSIVSSTPNTGSYSWTVPDTPSGTCLVRISDTAGPANDTSDAVFTISPAQISQSQRDALIALYNSTNGDSWTNNTNWRKPGEPTQFNDPGTEYTWYGVTCTTDNTNVEIVQIENNNLVGTIPVELNNLTTLTGLILNNNQLSGTMPDLSSLVNLTELKLSVNQLDGSIPAWLNNLVNLQIIHLNNNQFSGTIPDLSSLVNLTELNLAINSLSGTIPVWINNLTALTTIILSGNQLTGTIPDMGSLTQLLVLDLFTNQLTGTIPDLSGLVSLEKLRLGVNQLSGSIPVWINDLTTLQYLELPDNQFTGTIPYLGGLTQLKKLDLSENQLTGTIPAELGNLNALQTLWLGENQLDGAVPSDLGNLAALTWLNLNDNQLTGSIPTELGNISSLSYLHLDDNRLAGNIPAEIGNLTGLNSLRLNGNQLSGSIPGTLSNLTNLFTSYLDLSWNGLYTNDTNLRDFLNTKQYGGDWEITQTIAPTGLSTSEETHNSVKVSWTPIQYQGDSGEYRVYYTTTSGSDYTLAGNTADKTVDNYTVTALEANTTYYFVVETVTNQHFNNQNTVTSEYSIEISTTTLETPTLTISVPNGGQSWEAATSQSITWNSTGNITDVKIEYSTDNGSSWSTVIASTPNNGSYDWTVPNTPSTTCLVKIADIGGLAEDTSDAVFTIAEQRTLTVTAPNGTENWEGGTDHTITWNSSGSIANVQIEYSTDNGSSWNTVEASATNDGNYNWTVPNTPSGNCLVRINDTAGPATDTSNGVFTIAEQRTLTVTAPNGTENWEGGTSQTITWNSTGSIANVQIEYSTDNGSSWNTVESSTTNDGNYNWTVPNTPSTNCLVRISDTAGPATDTSNAVFTIAEQRTLTVTAPNGTESWEGGTSQTITWNSTGSIANVQIEYSTDNGSSWNTVEASTTNDGNYNWTVPNTPSTNCLVQISDTAGPATDTSNGVFTIIEQRTLSVTAPNGTENWEGGTDQTITWNSTGSIANVQIEYSTDNGSSWNTVEAS
ncbi:MAG: SBBP repeat-containing protein, partial [Candidatus Aminicenantes bacterium]